MAIGSENECKSNNNEIGIWAAAMEYGITDIVTYSRGAQFEICRYIYQKKYIEKISVA